MAEGHRNPMLTPPAVDDHSEMAELRRDVLDVARELGIDLEGDGWAGTAAPGAGPGAGSGAALDTGSKGGRGGGAAGRPRTGLDLRGSTPFRLARAARALARALRGAGDPARGLLLMEVGRGARWQSRISERLGIEPSALSQLVATAVARRLIRRRRDEGDRRRWVLELTEAGRREAEAVAARWRAVDERLLKRMTAAERDELRRLLRKAAVALASAGSGA